MSLPTFFVKLLLSSFYCDPMKQMTTLPATEELLSALVDGDLTSAECIEILDVCRHDFSLLNQWNVYHMVGGVLRSSTPWAVEGADMAFVSRLQHRLASEVAPVSEALHSRAALLLQPLKQEIVSARPDNTRPGQYAANDGSYRWKIVAGFASLAAVCAVAWGASGLMSRTDAPMLALDQGNAQLVVSSPMGLMVRDTRLEEQLADHRQLGGAAALQMPSGFFRNAAFETSKNDGR